MDPSSNESLLGGSGNSLDYLMGLPTDMSGASTDYLTGLPLGSDQSGSFAGGALSSGSSMFSSIPTWVWFVLAGAIVLKTMR